MRQLAAISLLFCGCSFKPPEQLDTLFEAANAGLRAGELVRAQTECDRGMSVAADRHDLVFQWKFRLLRAQTMLNSQRAEEVLDRLKDPVPQGPQFAPLAARKKMIEGQAHSILGHKEQYQALLEEAHHDAEAANAQDVLLEIEIINGSTLIYRERYDDAERTLQSALRRAQSLKSSYWEAAALVNLGRIQLRKHHAGQGAEFFEQAARVSGPQYKILYSVAIENLAICYSDLGDHDRAIRIQLDSIANHERWGTKFFLPGSVGQAGELYLAMGNLPKAAQYLERALSLASEMNRIGDAADWAKGLSDVYIELADWQHAETLNAEAIRLKKQAKVQTLYYNTLNSANIAAGRGELEKAAELYRQTLREGEADPSVIWEAHRGLGVLEAKQRRFGDAVKEFEAALDVVERSRADLLRTEFRLPFLTRSIRLYREYVDALLEQGQIERALAVADSSRAQVLAERSGSAPARRLPAGAFSKLAAASGSVLLSYWLTPEKSHVWVVTAREIRHLELQGARQIEPEVAQFREAIERQLADPLRTRLVSGERLYRMLIQPVQAFLPAGARVVIAPDGALHGLNLEMLPVPGEPVHYWIRDVALEIAPSLSSVTATTGHPAGSRLLLIGDPVTNDRAFPPLAYAEREIAGIRQNFALDNQDVFTRDAATPQAFLAAAARGPFATIHFAAHASANRESPLDSTVLLSGGKLYARDVMDLKLDTSLVTISACRGAGQRTYLGEGPVGLAWAFLRAGARNVIAGLWDVNDQSTAGLMESLYRELATGKRPADALRAAKLAMIGTRGNLRKPYYWAPFQVYTVAP
jgi:CHAT domain-containing protein